MSDKQLLASHLFSCFLFCHICITKRDHLYHVSIFLCQPLLGASWSSVRLQKFLHSPLFSHQSHHPHSKSYPPSTCSLPSYQQNCSHTLRNSPLSHSTKADKKHHLWPLLICPEIPADTQNPTIDWTSVLPRIPSSFNFSSLKKYLIQSTSDINSKNHDDLSGFRSECEH